MLKHGNTKFYTGPSSTPSETAVRFLLIPFSHSILCAFLFVPREKEFRTRAFSFARLFCCCCDDHIRRSIRAALRRRTQQAGFVEQRFYMFRVCVWLRVRATLVSFHFMLHPFLMILMIMGFSFLIPSTLTHYYKFTKFAYILLHTRTRTHTHAHFCVLLAYWSWCTP